MTIKIIANDKGNPPGKLAEAELHFTEGPLEGLKLIGFSVWERKSGNGGRNVTFPARSYSVNGERRSFSLLRPVIDSTAQTRIRDLILEAYDEQAAGAAETAERERGPTPLVTTTARAGTSCSRTSVSAGASTLRGAPCRTPRGRTATSCRRR